MRKSSPQIQNSKTAPKITPQVVTLADQQAGLRFNWPQNPTTTQKPLQLPVRKSNNNQVLNNNQLNQKSPNRQNRQNQQNNETRPSPIMSTRKRKKIDTQTINSFERAKNSFEEKSPYQVNRTSVQRRDDNQSSAIAAFFDKNQHKNLDPDFINNDDNVQAIVDKVEQPRVINAHDKRIKLNPQPIIQKQSNSKNLNSNDQKILNQKPPSYQIADPNQNFLEQSSEPIKQFNGHQLKPNHQSIAPPVQNLVVTSDQKRKAIDMTNHNVIEKARIRVNRQVRQTAGPPIKNKFGENIKKHFGTWKNFVIKQTNQLAEDENDQKQRCYISNECRKYLPNVSYKISKQEDQTVGGHKRACEQIQKVGHFHPDEPNRLEHWGIPIGICEQFYKHTGIKQLFPWQAECLQISPLVTQCKSNLVYFAPTSGGKSIVSEILLLRAILGFKKRAIYVLPFVSIVAEKCQTLIKLLENVNLKIIQLHAQSDHTWTPNCDLAICTIEKANSLINKLIEEQLYFDVQFVIIDEFHLIQDEQRGWMLETILSKLKTLERIFERPNGFQIVGMSATMSGLETLKQWLGQTAVYECTHRPVPLSEYIIDQGSHQLSIEPSMALRVQNQLKLDVKQGMTEISKSAGDEPYDDNQQQNLTSKPEESTKIQHRKNYNLKELCSLKLTQPKMIPLFPNDKDYMIATACAYLRKKKAVLIFCPTKGGCQKVALGLSKALPMQFVEYKDQKSNRMQEGVGQKQTLMYTDLVTELEEIKRQVFQMKKSKKQITREDIFDKSLNQKRLRLIEELRSCPSGLCDVLKQTVKYGIAYHHSGLTNDEKSIIEKGYRQGILLLLVATSTLSTGINLPAKAVIFKTPYIATQLMDCAKYKQMSGRAGRTGFDSRGEVVMICQNREQLKHVRSYLMQPFTTQLSSALTGSRLVRSILEMIASQCTSTLPHLQTFLESTLIHQLARSKHCGKCQSQVEYLQDLFSEKPSANSIQEFATFVEKFNLAEFITDEVNNQCQNCLKQFLTKTIAYLKQKHFLILENNKILPTPLGKAAFASSISPEESQAIFNDLVIARQQECLVLENDLQLLYLITPHFKSLREPNWDSYLRVYKRLTQSEQKIAKMYKLDRSYLEWAREIKPRLPDFITDKPSQNPSDDDVVQELYCHTENLKDMERTLIRHSKFFMSLLANELLKETPISVICEQYQTTRGHLQTIQQQILNYAGMMSAFCERLCWTDYSVLFMRITEKINWQVKDELLNLMQLPSLRPERARILYKNGLTDVKAVGECASVDALVKLFANSEGFITHRAENREDLQIKYECLYAFGHKIVSEARSLMLKQKYDPEYQNADGPKIGANLDIMQGVDFIVSSDEDDDSSSLDSKSSSDQQNSDNKNNNNEDDFALSQLDLGELDGQDDLVVDDNDAMGLLGLDDISSADLHQIINKKQQQPSPFKHQQQQQQQSPALQFKQVVLQEGKSQIQQPLPAAPTNNNNVVSNNVAGQANEESELSLEGLELE